MMIAGPRAMRRLHLDNLAVVAVGAIAALVARKGIIYGYERFRDGPVLPRAGEKEPVNEALGTVLLVGAVAGIARYFARKAFLRSELHSELKPKHQLNRF